MRKILFAFLLILLGILLVMTIISGFPVEGISTYSLQNIKESTDNLDSKIKEIEQITQVTYPKKNNDLTKNIKELETEKQNYLDKAQYSSVEDVARANMQQSYEAYYLWVTLGNYATKEGIVAKLDFTTSSSGVSGLSDIKFTLNGNYVSITDFIYSIENDQTLNFRIQDFAIVPGGAVETTTEESTATKGNDTNILQATFAVKDLTISF